MLPIEEAKTGVFFEEKCGNFAQNVPSRAPDGRQMAGKRPLIHAHLGRKTHPSNGFGS